MTLNYYKLKSTDTYRLHQIVEELARAKSLEYLYFNTCDLETEK
jgi:hypothetical protein